MKKYISIETVVYYKELDEKHVYTNYRTTSEDMDKIRHFIATTYKDMWQEVIDEHTSGGLVLSTEVKEISELDYKREAFKPHNKYSKAIRGY
ncbi:hypothetical protein [Bacillus sp. XF8]|uniref:hypothetical protein n=1 Tax=Bacillus sp. XF8 TaxID=2819289 RepID=UPI001AA01D17|nr:hypothetical protein [Bacillus sp. XF8]MBO1579361.1 hypothetical protein [Bacillus sp. XF8]